MQNWYKWLIDAGKSIIDNLVNLQTFFKLPIPAIASIGSAFWNMVNIVKTGVKFLESVFRLLRNKIIAEAKIEASNRINSEINAEQEIIHSL